MSSVPATDSLDLLSRIAECLEGSLALLQSIDQRLSLLVALQQGSATEWLSIKQATVASGLSESTVRRAVKSGVLKASNPGGSLQRPTYRIQRADLEAFMVRHGAESSVPQPRIFKRKVKSRHFGDL